MSGATGLLLSCTGDGRAGYKLSLKTDRSMDGVWYQLSFSPGRERQQYKLPFSAFRASVRGQPVRGAPPLRGEDVVQMGVMLSRFDDEGRPVGGVPAGPFRLTLDSLAAYA